MSEYVNLTRSYDAPREVVWSAWMEPEQVAQWWGPHEFRTPLESIEIEPRAGGRFHLVMMETATGTEYPVRYEIVELVPNELLLMRSDSAAEMGLDFEMSCRVEFAEVDGRTQVTVSTGPFTEQMAPMASKGWSAQCERLETMLAGARA